MRQGGFKPKGHNSGTYWVRANATNGKGKKTKITSEDDFSDVVEGLTSERATFIAKTIGRIAGLILAIFLIYVGITHSP